MGRVRVFIWSLNMAEIRLEGLKSRKLGIYGQNDVVLIHQSFFFFLTQGTTQKNAVLDKLK